MSRSPHCRPGLRAWLLTLPLAFGAGLACREASSVTPIVAPALPAATALRSQLRIRVQRGELILPLARATPLLPGDQLEIEGEFPRGEIPSILWRDSVGEWFRLAMQPLGASPGSESGLERWRCPGEDELLELEGPTGLELILAWSGDRVPTPEQLAAGFGAEDALALAGAAPLAIRGRELRPLRERGGASTPAGALEGAQRVGHKLQARFGDFSGFALRRQGDERSQ